MVSAQSSSADPTTAGQLSTDQSAAVTDTKRNNQSNQSSQSKESKGSSSSSSVKASSKAGSTSTTAKPSTPSPIAVPPKPAKPALAPPPAAPVPVAASSISHDNIISTVFWVGETADASNAHITNIVSSWDENWQDHYGGVDDPNNRNGYYPGAFTPKENPFYFALPYSDFEDNGNRRASAVNCPNAAALAGSTASWCKNSWIKITHAGKTTYAQWQDTGPLEEDDTAYVFGTSRPKNTWGARAGLDVSPAVRDYLGLQDVDTVSWSFVGASNVPGGPWKQIVTISSGT